MWNSTIRSRLARFQAILFCLLVASGTVFMHKHKTADGRIIIHTHPYNLKKDPDTNRHHQSDTEIHLLDIAFHGNLIQVQPVHYTQPVFTPACLVYLPYRTPSWQFNKLHYAYLRGPPQSV
ncbi:hypothetical protein [Parapedobacter koreensis]|uniref:Uncharacterized protein n=1 Tax=Parapedobacter koreensis TaxID=332977 RepID=A0A1H7EXT7_9SPHI|nr:hypothetical protein [Parapedobacter koreensis]SEK18693.1 hypothetical protein SAMN05421740_101113 [Parapedobacter koreensis]